MVLEARKRENYDRDHNLKSRVTKTVMSMLLANRQLDTLQTFWR